MNNSNLKSDLWTRAAVLGSIWASIEIIVGNFLHGFRLPFTGEILTFFAIYFLTAASVRWKLKGLIWRAGLICAMMKFFTPGVKVFGPIIGIVSESFMFEIMLRIFGMNPLGFIIGGGITLCLPLVQKLINLLILYGWNLVVVFDKSIEFLLKIINIHDTNSFAVLFILFLINFFFGALAAVLGYRSGKRKTDFKGIYTNGPFKTLKADTSPTKKVLPAFFRIIVNTAVIIFVLLFIKDYLIAASVIAVLYISYILYKYESSRRLFKNYKLWIQILVFTLLTALVLALVMNSGAEKSLLSGAEMFVRVLIITFGFSAISYEISRPAFKNFLRSKLNRNFSDALNLAFSALPEIINSSKGITSILNPGRFINELTYLMDVWHDKFKSASAKHIIVTGSQGSGKTSYIKSLITENTAGIYSSVVYENNSRIGYDALIIGSNEKFTLCRIGYESGLTLGKFGFYEDTFKIITDRITNHSEGKADTIIIDEIGLLEKDKKGWYDLLSWAMNNEHFNIILSVRKELVEHIKELFPHYQFEVIDTD